MDTLTRILILIPPHELPEGFITAAIEHARASGAEIKCLYVIDALWFNYSGADWLSEGASRAKFDLYMRETLRAEGEGFIERMSRAVKDAGLVFSSEIVEGAPAEAALMAASSIAPDAIITTAGFPGLSEVQKRHGDRVVVYP